MNGKNMPNSFSKKTFPGVLAGLLFCLVLMRSIAFWAHSPMLAYANNFDQGKIMSLLRLAPFGQNTGSPDAATPDSPIRYFSEEAGFGYMLYPSSDLAIKSLQLQAAKLIKTHAAPVDIKIFSLPLLAFWLAAMAWIAWQMGRASRWHVVGFCAWLLLICDPVNLLYLNTLYAEFSAFAAFSIFIGICWLALARRRISCTLSLAALAALLVLATSRKQYMFLPLALLGFMLLAPGVRRVLAKARAAIFYACSLLVIVVPILMYANDNIDAQVKTFNARIAARNHSSIDEAYVKYLNIHTLVAQVNTVDTVMSAVLPAAGQPDVIMQKLGLASGCTQFVGKNWHIVSYGDLKTSCPAVLEVPLTRLAGVLLRHPSILWRMTLHTASMPHYFIAAPHLAQVEGGGKLAQVHSLAARSLTEALEALPLSVLSFLTMALLLIPALLLAVLVWRHKWQQAAAMLFIAILTHYMFFSSILGDGYVEIGRHTVLCFSMGCLLAVALPYMLWQAFTPQARAHSF